MQRISSTNHPNPWLYQLWLDCLRFPAGKWLFSFLLGWKVPYSGSLKARIEQLEPGHCLLRFRDRRGIRNHLQSIHALALANAGELCSGLALMASLPDTQRGIPVEICTQYLHKARGTLVGKGRLTEKPPKESGEITVEGQLEDSQGEIVAITRVRWKISPRPDGPAGT